MLEGRTKSYDASRVTQVHVTTETYTQVQRSTVVPKYSINRGPVASGVDMGHDLEVQLEGDGEDDKGSFDGAMNTSEIRLTKGKESE
jgi:hypothetical protein